MTCSELFRQHPNIHPQRRSITRSVDMRVTVLAGPPSHQRSRRAQSPWLSDIDPSNQHLHSVAAAQNAGRRVEAGAGATSVFVPVIRHDTSFARRVSLTGRSRTCPDLSMANRRAIRGPADPISQESM